MSFGGSTRASRGAILKTEFKDPKGNEYEDGTNQDHSTAACFF